MCYIDKVERELRETLALFIVEKTLYKREKY